MFNEQKSGSEGDLRKSLIDIICGCKKMVVVTTFASNIARLDTLIHAGQKAGRKVVLTVSIAIPRLSPGLSRQTYKTACARFTPSNSD